MDEKKEAVDRLVAVLQVQDNDEDADIHDWQLSNALKSFAVKYYELLETEDDEWWSEYTWHNYFVKGIRKLTRDLPSTTADLEKEVRSLNREESEARDREAVAAVARARGVHIQILPGPPAPAPDTSGKCIDNNPEAPNQNSNQNANRKRQAENQAEDKVTAATDMEAQERPAKRVKHGGENTTTSRDGFTLETEGSLTFRISDDARISTINLNGRGPAIVTVNVQKKDKPASASANGNKGVNEEGAAS